MSTCKTCKWWDKDDPDSQVTADRYEFKIYDCVRGRCQNQVFKGMQAFDRSDVISILPRGEVHIKPSDFTAFRLFMATGPDFGCIHHEEKTNA